MSMKYNGKMSLHIKQEGRDGLFNFRSRNTEVSRHDQTPCAKTANLYVGNAPYAETL